MSFLRALAVVVFPLSMGCTSVSGQLRGAVAGGPPFTFIPNTCSSGAIHGFSGVLLQNDGNGERDVAFVYETVRHERSLRMDHEWIVIVRERPSGHETTFGQSECTTFEGNVAPTSVKVNGVRAHSGSMKLTCARDDGARIEGELVFENCST